MTIPQTTYEYSPVLEQVAPTMPPTEIESAPDSEDVFVLLTASKFHQMCGRGARHNWFYIGLNDRHSDSGKFDTTPPPPLASIDRMVWGRFVRKTRIRFKPTAREKALFFLLLLPFMVLMIIGDIWDAESDNDENVGDVPLWYCMLFALSFIIPFIIVCYWDKKEKTEDKEAKAVDKMRETLARQGYAIEYSYTRDCGQLFLCSYVRFSRIAGVVPTVLLEENLSEKYSNETYNPCGWAPLEGTWKGCCTTKTYSFQGVQSAASFSAKINGEENGEMVGNLFQWRENPNLVERFKKKTNWFLRMYLERKPEFMNALNKLDEAAGYRDLYPMPRDALLEHGYSSAHYFRNTTGWVVWKVEGSKMVHFSGLQDLWLTNQDILNGALDTLNNEDCEIDEFIKVGPLAVGTSTMV